MTRPRPPRSRPWPSRPASRPTTRCATATSSTADFLESETYPTLSLRSTKVTPKGGDRYELIADLTIKGVTKSVAFDLEFLGSGPGMAPGVNVAGFELTGEVDRRDFGINFEGSLENGSLVVGNKIVLELAVEVAAQLPVGATA